MTNIRIRACHCVVALLALAFFGAKAQAQTYTDLFDLDNDVHGCCPSYPSQLAQGRDGNLYGVTTSGGPHSDGTVFRMTPAGVVTVLHSFSGTDGSLPMGGLSLGMDGNFYGTTFEGGPVCCRGVIFKITPAGTYTMLYNFLGGTDGGGPLAPPVQGPDGNLYGTASSSSGATIYKITTAGVFTPLGPLPGASYGGLVLGNDGKFYGTTERGGTVGQGTFFSLTTAGVLTVIYSFHDATGDFPIGPLMLSADGFFYGTGAAGGAMSGGVVFKISPAGVYTKLHDFDSSGASLAKAPYGGVVQGSDGFLYGTTSTGSSGNGTIFKIKPNGTSFLIMHTFDGTHGAEPAPAPFLHTNGKIYGLTTTGGAHNQGVVYSFDAGLKPFAVPVVRRSAKVGSVIEMLGQNFKTSTGIMFGTGAGTETVVSNNYMTVPVPSSATTGLITVLEPSGNLLTPLKFKVTPTITSFSPTSGPVGTQVVVKGMSFTGATAVKFGTVSATVFTVNSNTQITTEVPSGAATGKIQVVTPGGAAISTTNFTVN
ncbi:MAG TPA: choice-of-anchor tandem repeat GloVer-containing protein [Candidatus Sulfotelmatobacter sp.]|nr:choice-of-anchor tandem repeat GloVer-containing protein [Candidatus Sulfotelmatobacter sp.]